MPGQLPMKPSREPSPRRGRGQKQAEIFNEKLHKNTFVHNRKIYDFNKNRIKTQRNRRFYSVKSAESNISARNGRLTTEPACGIYSNIIPSIDKGRHGFDGQKYPHTASSPLRIRHGKDRITAMEACRKTTKVCRRSKTLRRPQRGRDYRWMRLWRIPLIGYRR